MVEAGAISVASEPLPVRKGDVATPITRYTAVIAHEIGPSLLITNGPLSPLEPTGG
jgi:hypothetical protein